MAAVLPSPSQFPSSSSSSFSNDGPRHSITILSDDPSTALERESVGEEEQERKELRTEEEEDQLSLLALLVAVLRKSVASCRTEREKNLMEIGLPTDVRHVAHVTFDRFHGFLGLPVEFEPEVPRKALSASANVFGVSTESMQCSFDCRGNSVPTILLLMQRRLYAQGGLQAEGIFRINAENTQEEHVRDQLNSGNLPDGIDVHCLAGLIKAWFRELPTGVLDTLTSEQVMQCQTEDQCVALVKLLPSTESSLLDWAINLMADVVQEEHHNKMNAHNIAMVFAPNMTHMDDPLTALMYAVQVMNFLKTLIERTLKERKEGMIEATQASHDDPSDKNDQHSPWKLGLVGQEGEHGNDGDECILLNPCHLPVDEFIADNTAESSHPEGDSGFDRSMLSSDEQPHEVPKESANVASASHFATGDLKSGCHEQPHEVPKESANVAKESMLSSDEQPHEVPKESANVASASHFATGDLKSGCHEKSQRNKSSHPSISKHKKTVKKVNGQPPFLSTSQTEKSRGISIIRRINSKVERVEAWR